MKKNYILFSIGLFLLLSGCQYAQVQTSMQTNEHNGEINLEKLSLLDTEYGSGAISDGADTNRDEEVTRIITDNAKDIIVYFSRSGNSQNLARIIRNELEADILEIEITEPYSSDYDRTIERANRERDNNTFSEIRTEMPDFSQYDNVYLGYRVWSSGLSNPIISFLTDSELALNGKNIYPFATHAGYGIGKSLTQIQSLIPEAVLGDDFDIQDEKLINNQEDVITWLTSIKSK